MRTRAKRFYSIFLAVVSIATLSVGITAHAAKQSYGFSLAERGGSAWSSGNEKSDNEQTAYIYTTGGSVSATSYAYFQLYKTTSSTAANALTNSQKITSNSARYLMPYTTERGTGSISYIHANAGYYSTSASGYWYS